MILAVTGHRPPKLGGYYVPNPVFDAVIVATRHSLRELHPELVYCGMALGFDQWVAMLCVELQIPFEAIVPFHGYESRWIDSSKTLFYDLCARARRTVYVTDTTEYHPSLMHQRNRWMVDNADRVLALWNGSAGGTASCVRYALLKGVPLYQVELPPWIWEEAATIEQNLILRRQARQSAAVSVGSGGIRSVEAFPAPPMPMDSPTNSDLDEERRLGALLAQAYTDSVQRSLTPTADEILQQVVLPPSVDAGVPGGDYTAISVRQGQPRKETTIDPFRPGRIIDLGD